MDSFSVLLLYRMELPIWVTLFGTVNSVSFVLAKALSPMVCTLGISMLVREDAL